MKVFITIIVSLLLTACGTRPTIQTVTEFKTIIVTVPSELFVPIITPAPPVSVEEYMQMDISDRETVLTSYNIQLLGTIKSCNEQIYRIKQHQDQSAESIKKNE